MKCSHGVPYPTETDAERGPWLCNPDGSNPNCQQCEPDAWAKTLHSWVDLGAALSGKEAEK